MDELISVTFLHFITIHHFDEAASRKLDIFHVHHGENAPFATAARVIEAEDMETALREAERRLTGLWNMEKDGLDSTRVLHGVCVVISHRLEPKTSTNHRIK